MKQILDKQFKQFKTLTIRRAASTIPTALPVAPPPRETNLTALTVPVVQEKLIRSANVSARAPQLQILQNRKLQDKLTLWSVQIGNFVRRTTLTAAIRARRTADNFWNDAS